MKQEDLEKFKMGYFILYRNTGGWFSNGIQARQIKAGFKPWQARYVHVEVSGGKRHSVNISPPISQFIDITKKHKGKKVCVVRFKDKDYEKKGRYKVAYFSATLCNTFYDIRGILSFIFKWIKQNNRHFFCSEGACWALQKEFKEALNSMKPSKCMPAHFLNLNKFKIVWKGTIE